MKLTPFVPMPGSAQPPQPPVAGGTAPLKPSPGPPVGPQAGGDGRTGKARRRAKNNKGGGTREGAATPGPGPAAGPIPVPTPAPGPAPGPSTGPPTLPATAGPVVDLSKLSSVVCVPPLAQPAGSAVKPAATPMAAHPSSACPPPAVTGGTLVARPGQLGVGAGGGPGAKKRRRSGAPAATGTAGSGKVGPGLGYRAPGWLDD
jgi:hypothetical protein